MFTSFEGPRDQVEEGLDAEAVVEERDHLFEGESGLRAGDGQLVDGSVEEWSIQGRIPVLGTGVRVTWRSRGVCV